MKVSFLHYPYPLLFSLRVYGDLQVADPCDVACMKIQAIGDRSRTHYLKALTYFRDAEAQPMPDMLVPLEWAAVTKFFVAEVPRLSHLS